MTTADDPFDSKKLLTKIQDILESNSIQRASVSFRIVTTNSSPPKTELERFLTWEAQAGGKDVAFVNSTSDTRFHIASITKILVATAMIHAIEVKAEEVPDNRWSKFKGLLEKPIRDVYNEYRVHGEPEMDALPGDPTVYEYIVHSKGLYSSNDHILAPDGTPLLDLKDLPFVLRELSRRVAKRYTGPKRWTNYSNMNYAVIALLAVTLWDGDLDNFMQETLFKPLRMHSTSISFPKSGSPRTSRWTVDHLGVRRQVQIPDYEASGAEAGALGAYSTAWDLDLFFHSVIKADQGVEPDLMKGFSTTVQRLLEVENKYIDEELHYMPLGLSTKLNWSTIGIPSINGLQFRDEHFTTFPVIPGDVGEDYEIYYMVGSALGCCCATALRVHDTKSFALVILTDTSGPVGVADHILRSVLRRFVDLQQNPLKRMLPSNRDSVTTMMKEASEAAVDDWKNKVGEDQRLIDAAHAGPFDIQGTFEATNFHQTLHVKKASDGKTYLTVSGTLKSSRTNRLLASQPLQLLWKDDNHLWLCVPPHMSVDRLGDGDWSNVLFRVVRARDGTLELRRKTKDNTEDCYIRQP